MLWSKISIGMQATFSSVNIYKNAGRQTGMNTCCTHTHTQRSQECTQATETIRHAMTEPKIV